VASSLQKCAPERKRENATKSAQEISARNFDRSEKKIGARNISNGRKIYQQVPVTIWQP
jgi:hypothetical protein